QGQMSALFINIDGNRRGVNIPPPSPPALNVAPGRVNVVPQADILLANDGQLVQTATFVNQAAPTGGFWERFQAACVQEDKGQQNDRAQCEHRTLARLAALMQI